MSFGAQLGAKGWQTGTVIPHDMVGSLIPHLTRPAQGAIEISAADWLIVISQTCDVVQLKLENEPLVEVLYCKPVKQLRPEFQGRKSTRWLDFRPNRENHPAIMLSAHAIADRYVVPRELFLEREPDPTRKLSNYAVRNVQLWYALRYTRPAWPDAFVRRLDPSKKKLTDTLKSLNSFADEIEVRIAILEKTDELDDEHDYHLTVFFVIDQIVWDSDPLIRKTGFEVFENFNSILSGCKGIAIDRDLSGIKSGDEFSWQMTKNTDEWNFANLSSDD